MTPRYPSSILPMSPPAQITNNNPLAHSPRFSTLGSGDTANTALEHLAATPMRRMYAPPAPLQQLSQPSAVLVHPDSNQSQPSPKRPYQPRSGSPKRTEPHGGARTALVSSTGKSPLEREVPGTGFDAEGQDGTAFWSSIDQNGAAAAESAMPMQAGGPTIDQLLAMDNGGATAGGAPHTHAEEEAGEGDAEAQAAGAEDALAEDFIAAAAAAESEVVRTATFC